MRSSTHFGALRAAVPPRVNRRPAGPRNSADEADPGQTLTYGELNCAANRLAHLLGSLGVGPDSRVAVLLDRTPGALVALLGVLKAGGAFVPLDASDPRERMALLFGDARPSVVVTLEKYALDVPLDRSRIVTAAAPEASFRVGTLGGGEGGGVPRIFARIHLPRTTGDVRFP